MFRSSVLATRLHRLPSRVFQLDAQFPRRARLSGAEQLFFKSLGVRDLSESLCFEVALVVDGLFLVHIVVQIEDRHAGVLFDLRLVLKSLVRAPQQLLANFIGLLLS